MMTGAEFPSIVRPCADPMAPPSASPSLPSEGGFQGHGYTGNGPPLCAGCSQPIMDKFILQVQGHMWHSRCLRCAVCHVSLSQTCYAGNNLLYCQDDFYRLFGTHCSACKANIPPTEVVRRAHDNVYHLNCFRCTVCGRELCTGDEFYLGVEGHLLCQADYVAVKDKEQDENENPERPPIPPPTESQKLHTLVEYFDRNSTPKREEMEQLARRLGVELEEVRIWFKQKRAKMRRKEDDSSNSSKIMMTNKVIPPPGGYPLPIVNKARSPGRLPTIACQPAPPTTTLTLGHPSFPQSHQHPHTNHSFHAWEELWSNDFVPPNVDLEPNNLKNGEVIRLDTSASIHPIRTPHFPPPNNASLPAQSSVGLHPHQHHPCNLGNSNEHGIGSVPWVS